MARQKTPERLIEVDELPRTPMGKVKKANATVEVLMHAIRDPRHLIFHGMSGAAREQPGLALLG